MDSKMETPGTREAGNHAGEKDIAGQLFDILEKQGMGAQSRELMEIMRGIAGMQEQVGAMAAGMEDLRRQLARMQEGQPKGIRDALMETAGQLGEKAVELSGRLSEIKGHFADTALQAVRTFREKGRRGMERVLLKGIIKIRKLAMDYREHVAGDLAAHEQKAARIDKIGSELKQAGNSIANAGRLLTGREALDTSGQKPGTALTRIAAAPVRKAIAGLKENLTRADAVITGLDSLSGRLEQSLGQEHEKEKASSGGQPVQPKRQASQPKEQMSQVEKHPESRRKSTMMPSVGTVSGASYTGRGSLSDAGYVRETQETVAAMPEKKEQETTDGKQPAAGNRFEKFYRMGSRIQQDNTGRQQGSAKKPEPLTEYTGGPYPIPDNYITEILRTGGGRRDSRSRIYAAYRQGRTPEEMAALLKKEYGTVGKGFSFDGRPLSAWFDDSGMRLAYGASAKGGGASAYTWEEVERNIRGMVENGAYMDAAEAKLVDDYEKGYTASRVESFFRETEQIFWKSALADVHGMADFHAIKKQLSGSQGIDSIISRMDAAMERLESDGISLEGRLGFTPQELRDELSGLKKARLDLPVPEKLDVIKDEAFITQDEFILRTGAGSSRDGSFRIYDYFKEKHSAVDKMEFLKTESGAENVIPALMGAEHVFWNNKNSAPVLKNDSAAGRCTKESLSWGMVEKDISRMVEGNSYLAPDSGKAYRQYRQGRQEYSRKLECREAIGSLIKEQYTGGRTPRGAARRIIEKYGWKCVEDVLASSVMRLKDYGCFSADNRRWAVRTALTEGQWKPELAVSAHPVYVETFINQARRYQRRCELEQARDAGVFRKPARPAHEEENAVNSSRTAYVQPDGHRQDECKVAENPPRTDRISIKSKMEELKKSSQAQEKTEEKTAAADDPMQGKTEAKTAAGQHPEQGSAVGAAMHGKIGQKAAGEPGQAQNNMEKKPSASRQGRVSIKGKMAEIQETSGSRKLAQKPPAARGRQKEACL